MKINFLIKTDNFRILKHTMKFWKIFTAPEILTSYRLLASTRLIQQLEGMMQHDSEFQTFEVHRKHSFFAPEKQKQIDGERKMSLKMASARGLT